MSDNSYQGQLQGPRRSAHDDFQPLGWGRSASWVNGPDQGRSSLAIDETFSIESIQGSVLFLMSNRFDRFDWIYSLSPWPPTADMRSCTTQVQVHIECNSETH